MSVISNFENRIEGAVDGAAAAVFKGPIEPAQIAKKAEKQMKREKLVGSGRQYAPTLYNVLVNARDDKRLFGFYPTMAAEIENYLYAKGTEAGMEFDTRPLVRFIPDPGLKKGRFDVIAEVVASPIIQKLRVEEMEYYGLAPKKPEVVETPAEPPAAKVAARPAVGQYAASERAAPWRGGATRSPLQSDSYEPSEYFDYSKNDKFAGLDIPAVIDDDFPDPSGFPPLMHDRAAEDESFSLSPLSLKRVDDAVIPLPADKVAAPVPVSVPDEIDAPSREVQEPTSVVGQARIFNHTEHRSYRLENRKVTIGRGKENLIVVTDAKASRIHALLTQDAKGKWKVTDLGATNGTKLNGRFVTNATLSSNDELTIGTTVFQFTE